MTENSLNRILLVALLALGATRVSPAEEIPQHPLPEGWTWIAATDEDQVKRTGEWKPERFRFALAEHLYTTDEDASLSIRFHGTAVGLRLGGQNTPPYSGQGGPSLARLVCHVDGKRVASFRTGSCSREVLLTTGLAEGEHELTVKHQLDGSQEGCRVEGVFACQQDPGLVSFPVQGEKQAFLVDVRATLRQGSTVVRSVIARNWLNGDCSLLVPAGENYSLLVEAIGWVREAVVERRFPDTIFLRIEERDPLALWQKNGRLFVIDNDGVVIKGASPQNYALLPVIVGDDAPANAGLLLTVLASEPSLHQRVAAAVRVGGRRWNLRFDNGVDVELPEQNFAAAWRRLAEFERIHQLLARDITAIDLRLPDRLVVRPAEAFSGWSAEGENT